MFKMFNKLNREVKETTFDRVISIFSILVLVVLMFAWYKTRYVPPQNDQSMSRYDIGAERAQRMQQKKIAEEERRAASLAPRLEYEFVRDSYSGALQLLHRDLAGNEEIVYSDLVYSFPARSRDDRTVELIRAKNMTYFLIYGNLYYFNLPSKEFIQMNFDRNLDGYYNCVDVDNRFIAIASFNTISLLSVEPNYRSRIVGTYETVDQANGAIDNILCNKDEILVERSGYGVTTEHVSIKDLNYPRFAYSEGDVTGEIKDGTSTHKYDVRDKFGDANHEYEIIYIYDNNKLFLTKTQNGVKTIIFDDYKSQIANFLYSSAHSKTKFEKTLSVDDLYHEISARPFSYLSEYNMIIIQIEHSRDNSNYDYEFSPIELIALNLNELRFSDLVSDDQLNAWGDSYFFESGRYLITVRYPEYFNQQLGDELIKIDLLTDKSSLINKLTADKTYVKNTWLNGQLGPCVKETGIKEIDNYSITIPVYKSSATDSACEYDNDPLEKYVYNLKTGEYKLMK